jgi:hypothetical protein
MVSAPTCGSSGAPQVGHLNARMDESLAIYFLLQNITISIRKFFEHQKFNQR